jgi:hypothetical protein
MVVRMAYAPGMGAGLMATIDNKIAAKLKRIEALDARIGRMMSDRVTLEDELALLYAQKSAPSPLASALKTILAPGFGD